MSKADVLALVQQVALDLADPVQIDRYHDEILTDLARQTYLVTTTIVPSAVAATSYPWPPRAVALLGVFYDDAQVGEALTDELDLYDEQWRDRVGAPAVYVQDGQTEHLLRLVPRPSVASKDFVFLVGSPLGLDYPEYSVGLLHTERRDVLPWMELPVALLVCAREFSRESPHRDTKFAEACQQLANALWSGMTA